MLRSEGDHRSQNRAIAQQPLAKVLPSLVGETAPLALYFYEENCPFCGMDHLKVQAAVRAAALDRLEFVPVHLGRTSGQEQYWTVDSAGRAPRILYLHPDSARAVGVLGVPLLVLAVRGHILAAWEGRIRWTQGGLALAIECQFGARLSCSRAAIGDTWQAAAARFRSIPRRLASFTR